MQLITSLLNINVHFECLLDLLSYLKHNKLLEQYHIYHNFCIKSLD